MQYFRRLLTCRKLGAVLVIGMLLRSTIASGYMLDTAPADGSLISVKICPGPAGINAIPWLDQDSQHHSHQHGHSDQQQEHNDHKDHDHALVDHPFSSCSFWSSSSQSLLADISFYNLESSFFTDEAIFHQPYFIQQQLTNTRLARAPPAPC